MARLEARARELLPEAVERAKRRVAQLEHTAHVDLPHALQVWVTWQGSAALLELVVRTGPPIRRWAVSPSEIERVYWTELVEAVRQRAGADWTPTQAEIPEFTPRPEIHHAWATVLREELKELMPPSPHLRSVLDRLGLES
jgi:hypothetical protein